MGSGWSLCALLVLVACNAPPQAPSVSAVAAPNADVLHVSVEAQQELTMQEAHVTRLAETLTFPGRIQYSLDGYAKIGTPIVGIVKTVQGRLGDKVKAGQVLVTIESADIGLAYSDFAKAEAGLQLTQRYLEIAKDLFKVKSLSKKEFDQAQNDYNKAQAEYRRARQRLLTLRVSPSELDKPASARHISTRFDLKSPLQGVIVEKTVTVGQVVGQDQAQTLFTVADLETLQVVAEVYERDLRFLRAGMAASVTVGSFPGHVFPAKLIHVGEVVDPASRTIKVRCDVTNLEYKLKPEMFARVQIVLASAPTAVVLPRSAVLRMGTEAIVFVQRNETEFERRAVVPGPVSEGMIEIRDGLHQGDRVVVKGAVLLKGALERALEQVHIQSL